jgi:hypothetical protein
MGYFKRWFCSGGCSGKLKKPFVAPFAMAKKVRTLYTEKLKKLLTDTEKMRQR